MAIQLPIGRLSNWYLLPNFKNGQVILRDSVEDRSDRCVINDDELMLRIICQLALLHSVSCILFEIV